MSNRVKGITIEIGGDTTPLQKALSDVNDKSSKLKSELKDVERLLKLDPTNTTLLAQKQELLGQSIQATKEKLDKLREAEASVQEQAAKGTITQEQYRAFQREVESTAEELGYLERKQAEATTEIDKGGEATKKAAKEADNAKDKWKKFGEALKTVGEIATKAIVALGSAATAAGAAIVGMSANAAYNADDLNTLAKTTGLTTETLQKFQYASNQIDVSMETLTGSLSKLTKNMNAARDGTGTAADAFRTLGVSVTDSRGQLRDNEEVFMEVIAALGKIENETERDALAMQIFGKSAQELNPLIMGGAESLRALGDEAEEAGLILSQDMLDSLNTLSDAMDTAKATTSALGNLFGTVFAEDIAGIVNEFTASAQRLSRAFRDGGVDALADEFGAVLGDMVNRIAEILPKVVQGGLQIVQKFAGSILDNAASLTSTAVTIVTMLVQALFEALPQVATAAAQIVATMGETIGENLPTLIPVIVSGIVQFTQAIVEQLPTILEAVVQIIEGLAVGIIDSLPIIVQALPQIITGIVEALIGLAPKLIECGITLFTALVENLPEIIEGIAKALPEIITGITGALSELAPDIIETGVTLFTSLIKNIPQIITGIVEHIPEIIKGIIDAIIGLYSEIADCGFDLFTSLIENLPDIIAKIITAIPDIIAAMIKTITEVLPKIASAGVELFTALTKNLPQILFKILQAIPEIGKAIVKAFTERHPEIAEAGFALFTKIVEKGKEIITEVKNFVGNLVDSVVSVVSGSFQSFYNVGYDIVTGIWNGISSGWGWLTSQVSSIAHNLLQAAKDALGIHSPSAVFRDEVGKMMAAGIGEGFNDETPKQFQRIKGRLSAEEKKLAASVTNNSTTNKSVSLGGIVVNINGGVQSAAEARRYGNEIAGTIQRELRYKGVLQLA